MHASYSKLSKELKNGIEILVGEGCEHIVFQCIAKSNLVMRYFG